jgi:hypothetical protein
MLFFLNMQQKIHLFVFFGSPITLLLDILGKKKKQKISRIQLQTCQFKKKKVIYFNYKLFGYNVYNFFNTECCCYDKK